MLFFQFVIFFFVSFVFPSPKQQLIHFDIFLCKQIQIKISFLFFSLSCWWLSIGRNVSKLYCFAAVYLLLGADIAK